ncbi:MAG: quinol dehydrogenase ferredoxin subunit NapH [Deltaproteobacteria bacterium]|nr:quinol dehydrogenase ferredoxin subunit NapH [Deltaproteobacteria bacterium]MBT4642568.1 quinol dehydrogenase ferredoxin subunit NapH [Deltaproteobacteria bacterium]MBT6503702.1 quinol dehydrogenase ferredoxin subunit NapH [Deltaproteobacteria bacterium]MBT6615593.1 quinol dehydrogenase ferredoxin subunit NapH [Deltaproteobacteria bacterium]MBT7151225.1 quinol dehydrogenase ferredoxin subunit NapH [Deltaproteobacteria bacterium]
MIYRNRFAISRRICQLSILLLFYTSFIYDWKIGGVEVLEGNLSASTLFGMIPLTDPYAAFQILFSGHSLLFDTLMGAVIILGFYLVFGGRAFCSWVCPVNMITDNAQKLRARFKIPSLLKINRRARYWILGLSLVLSFLSGVAAFEWISPISMLHRELIYGMQMGWVGVAVIFLFDLFIQKQAWCGHLCPLGGFYSILGRVSLLRINFNKEKCTKCGDCHRICPEPQVLNLAVIFKEEMVYSGNCTNCGRCITQCPEECFQFSLRKSRPDNQESLLKEINFSENESN